MVEAFIRDLEGVIVGPQFSLRPSTLRIGDRVNQATNQATNDVWEVLAISCAIRRFTDEPVDEETLGRCLEAATWAPSGGT